MELMTSVGKEAKGFEDLKRIEAGNDGVREYSSVAEVGVKGVPRPGRRSGLDQGR